ncbi:uncharacterized protein UHO2_02267 [Ustilago hordei]|uniref:uncharacterized protein n=1 Tax=Ustilago hordei TaxID=120017 RepID=UPI001A63412E|nr:uncharacterized protein UHO2_02267 [Ustilago hordei]SYW86033.1 related to YEA4 - uridine diphosphate-N-acetylglucosamine transporter [Ustilago hordei]
MPSSPAPRRRNPSTPNKTKPTPTTSSTTTRNTASSIIATTASEWLFILTLIFGGCCSNAFTLELATQQLPSSGTLITFAHILNNLAFGYDVPMSVHIVFRSGGLVVNMILGYLVQGRRYPPVQVGAVVLVTLGVVSSTLSSSASRESEGGDERVGQYATGVLLLFSALVLTGFMGLWQERTFKLYGNQNWRESLFYSHLLSLPMFLLRPGKLVRDVQMANGTTPWWFGLGPPTSTPSNHPSRLGNLLALISPPSLTQKLDSTSARTFDLTTILPFTGLKGGWGVWIPSFWPPLLLNVATQLLCINGVNRLTSKVSSLSVTLVLVVRKAVSLVISVMLVQGGKGNLALWIGAGCVLAGTVGYSMSKPVTVNEKEGQGKKKE